MKVEIPIIRRCCCWLPLRRGILIFAYINLLITMFFGIMHLLIWWMFYKGFVNTHISMYRGVVIETHIIFTIILHVFDLAFNAVLIVGAHKKASNLMRLYCYYQVTTMIANFLAMLVTYSDIYKYSGRRTYSALSELCVAFLGYVIQIYLLLLIHSELNKQRYKEGRTSFVNRMSEVYLEPTVRQDERYVL